jgi:hypothetical protein
MEKTTDNNVDSVLKKFYISEESILNKQYPLCVASFPRSGNTMIRTIYENTTLTYTGDDMIVKYDDQSETQLNFYDLGTHNTIKNTFLIKTHYPNFAFKPNEFKAQGAIFLIRNPFDAFDSFFEMTRTDSHCKKLSDDARKDPKVESKFQEFINWIMHQYSEYHEYWIENFLKVPVKIIKYEWFINNKEQGTKEIFDYLFKFKADKNYFGNLSEEEILEKLKSSNTVHSISYKPGNASNYTCLKKGRFNQELLDKIIDLNYEVLHFFGYIEEFKKQNFEDLNSAILKKEKTMQENNIKTKDWGYKFEDYNQISDKLFENFSKVDNPLSRNYLVINDKSNEKEINNYEEHVKFFDIDFEEWEKKFGTGKNKTKE